MHNEYSLDNIEVKTFTNADLYEGKHDRLYAFINTIPDGTCFELKCSGLTRKTVQTCIRRSSHITGKIKVKNTLNGLMIYKLKESQ